MSALRTALADRKHDLPPLWDGIPVDWDPWQVLVTSARFHLPLDRLVCRSCGSLATRSTCMGRVTGAPESVADVHRRLIIASRCPDCGHDVVHDLETDESWDLDPSDYGDEGSWDPEKAQGALF